MTIHLHGSCCYFQMQVSMTTERMCVKFWAWVDIKSWADIQWISWSEVSRIIIEMYACLSRHSYKKIRNVDKSRIKGNPN